MPVIEPVSVPVTVKPASFSHGECDCICPLHQQYHLLVKCISGQCSRNTEKLSEPDVPVVSDPAASAVTTGVVGVECFSNRCLRCGVVAASSEPKRSDSAINETPPALATLYFSFPKHAQTFQLASLAVEASISLKPCRNHIHVFIYKY